MTTSDRTVFDAINVGTSLTGLPEFKVHQSLCNPFMMLHGGAAAVATESAIHQKKCGKTVLQIDLSYLSSVAIGRSVSIVFDGKYGGHDIMHGYLMSNGRNAVQFSTILGKL